MEPPSPPHLSPPPHPPASFPFSHPSSPRRLLAPPPPSFPTLPLPWLPFRGRYFSAKHKRKYRLRSRDSKSFLFLINLSERKTSWHKRCKESLNREEHLLTQTQEWKCEVEKDKITRTDSADCFRALSILVTKLRLYGNEKGLKWKTAGRFSNDTRKLWNPQKALKPSQRKYESYPDAVGQEERICNKTVTVS